TGSGSDRGPRGFFVWSFYQEPDADQFLQRLYHYVKPIGTSLAAARGVGLLHALHEALGAGGPHFLVLAGLERVQHPGDQLGVYGRIDDPLLRGLLTRLAEGIGKTTALVTSRFPLTDVRAHHDAGYVQIDVESLDHHAALELLRQRGVKGDAAAL